MCVVLTYGQSGTDVNVLRQKAIELAKEVRVTPTA